MFSMNSAAATISGMMRSLGMAPAGGSERQTSLAL
jgi:hypothetical protein